MNEYYLVKVYGLKHIYKHEPIYLIYNSFNNYVIKDFTSLDDAQNHLAFLKKTKFIYNILKTHLIKSFNNIEFKRLTSDNNQDIELEATFDINNRKILIINNESDIVDSLIVELYMQDKFQKDQQARLEFEQDVVMQTKKNENKSKHN